MSLFSLYIMGKHGGTHYIMDSLLTKPGTAQGIALSTEKSQLSNQRRNPGEPF